MADKKGTVKRLDLISKTSYVPGVKVFFVHPNDAWIVGQISGVGRGTYTVTTLTGEEHSVKELDIHPIIDESVLQTTEDLLKLSELHEATLLNNIKERFSKDIIYTNVGPIVIALNPFKKLPLYSEENIRQYHEVGRKDITQLPPHIFTVAETSYNSMLTSGANQSILISGESGAGKTETTKYIMKYLAQVSGTARNNDAGKIQHLIMQANPILEAFGNAKTLRNDNSSRFGKFIRIQFDSKGFLTGAEITNYLLEKSRVVKQAAGERSYHIFYQLINGTTDEEKQRYKIGPPESFSYLNQSGCSVIDGVNDSDEFKELSNAIDVVGIPPAEKDAIFRILSGILHLGNVTFQVDEKKTLATAKIKNMKEVEEAASLFQVNAEQLAKAITIRRNCIRGEWFTVPLNSVEAIDARDALAKALYNSMFHWLVERINQTIHDDSAKFIGLLDIFGFEHFKVNSFEQFSINFCNEKLQQHYNRHTFKWEQEACQAEEIDYTKIDFVDNQICLDLIEKKPLGVLSLLDEECNFPKGSDSSFLNKLNTNFPAHPNFQKPKLSKTAFLVRHYAGDVTYETIGFLEKNRDTLQDELVNVMQTSTCPFSKNLLEKSDKKKGKKLTVGGEFKLQLDSLMSIINSTEPHWIRCIKPNSEKKSDIFSGAMVLKQLTCAGVLETIRIRRSGYPIRIPVEDFFKRFKVLHPKITGKSSRSACSALLQQLALDPKNCQLGLTKVFLKADQYNKLEEMREKQLQVPAKTIQRVARGWLARMKYKKTRAIIKLQRLTRVWIQRRRYLELKEKLIILQSSIRGFLARKEAERLLMEPEPAPIIKVPSVVPEKVPEIVVPEMKEEEEEPKPVKETSLQSSRSESTLFLSLNALATMVSPGQPISLEQLESIESQLEKTLRHVRDVKRILLRSSSKQNMDEEPIRIRREYSNRGGKSFDRVNLHVSHDDQPPAPKKALPKPKVHKAPSVTKEETTPKEEVAPKEEITPKEETPKGEVTESPVEIPEPPKVEISTPISDEVAPVTSEVSKTEELTSNTEIPKAEESSKSGEEISTSVSIPEPPKPIEVSSTPIDIPEPPKMPEPLSTSENVESTPVEIPEPLKTEEVTSQTTDEIPIPPVDIPEPPKPSEDAPVTIPEPPKVPESLSTSENVESTPVEIPEPPKPIEEVSSTPVDIPEPPKTEELTSQTTDEVPIPPVDIPEPPKEAPSTPVDIPEPPKPIEELTSQTTDEVPIPPVDIPEPPKPIEEVTSQTTEIPIPPVDIPEPLPTSENVGSTPVEIPIPPVDIPEPPKTEGVTSHTTDEIPIPPVDIPEPPKPIEDAPFTIPEPPKMPEPLPISENVESTPVEVPEPPKPIESLPTSEEAIPEPPKTEEVTSHTTDEIPIPPVDIPEPPKSEEVTSQTTEIPIPPVEIPEPPKTEELASQTTDEVPIPPVDIPEPPKMPESLSTLENVESTPVEIPEPPKPIEEVSSTPVDIPEPPKTEEVNFPSNEEIPLPPVDVPEVPKVEDIPQQPLDENVVEVPKTEEIISEVPNIENSSQQEIPPVEETPIPPVDLSTSENVESLSSEILEVPKTDVEVPNTEISSEVPVELPEIPKIDEAPVEVPEIGEVSPMLSEVPVELPETPNNEEVIPEAVSSDFSNNSETTPIIEVPEPVVPLEETHTSYENTETSELPPPQEEVPLPPQEEVPLPPQEEVPVPDEQSTIESPPVIEDIPQVESETPVEEVTSIPNENVEISQPVEGSEQFSEVVPPVDENTLVQNSEEVVTENNQVFEEVSPASEENISEEAPVYVEESQAPVEVPAVEENYSESTYQQVETIQDENPQEYQTLEEPIQQENNQVENEESAPQYSEELPTFEKVYVPIDKSNLEFEQDWGEEAQQVQRNESYTSYQEQNEAISQETIITEEQTPEREFHFAPPPPPPMRLRRSQTGQFDD